jgi:hypothetical protein
VELGPWEADHCLSHPSRGRAPDATSVRWWTIADLAVLALEREPAVVSIYDIGRAISREFGREVQPVSLTALVGSDRRFCWSGKGLYGLFRHGRIPGERTLSGTSRFILAAADETLTLAELSYILKSSGYRFQDGSLEGALDRDRQRHGFVFERGGFPDWARTVRLEDVEDARAELVEALEVDDPFNGPWPAKLLIDRWAGVVDSALAERRRRLDSSGASAGAK